MRNLLISLAIGSKSTQVAKISGRRSVISLGMNPDLQPGLYAFSI